VGKVDVNHKKGKNHVEASDNINWKRVGYSKYLHFMLTFSFM
jgi:hypothetical protein